MIERMSHPGLETESWLKQSAKYETIGLEVLLLLLCKLRRKEHRFSWWAGKKHQHWYQGGAAGVAAEVENHWTSRSKTFFINRINWACGLLLCQVQFCPIKGWLCWMMNESHWREDWRLPSHHVSRLAQLPLEQYTLIVSATPTNHRADNHKIFLTFQS